MGHDPGAMLIHNEVDLVAALEWTGPTAINDWLHNEVELADEFEVDDDLDPEDRFHRTAFGGGTHYLIDLTYPFTLEQLQEEADRADLHIRGTIHASGAAQAATLGTPDGDDDGTESLGWLLSVDTHELVEILGGEWQSMEFATEFGWEGQRIHGWFVPSDDRPQALGIGAGELFVLPLHGDDKAGYWIDPEEGFPHPNVWAYWMLDWTEGQPSYDPHDSLNDLRRALGQPVAPGVETTVESRRSAEHVVRLSTKNLLVAGIDLDFEVKRGGCKLGTLSVSEGGLLWRPAGAHRRKGRAKAGIPITWSEFASWAEA